MALGGIDATTAPACLAAGAAAVAVMGEMMRAVAPGEAASRLVEALTRFEAGLHDLRGEAAQ